MEATSTQSDPRKGQHPQSLTEDEAREYIERLRWPSGPACPHCGAVNVYRMTGKSFRKGLLACRDCDGNFTVTVGTVMANSHLPLATWISAFYLMTGSTKGISAAQLQRNLGLGSYRTAWQLARRIREAMKCEPVLGLLLGSVRCDEVDAGGKPPVRPAATASGESVQVRRVLSHRETFTHAPASLATTFPCTQGLTPGAPRPVT